MTSNQRQDVRLLDDRLLRALQAGLQGQVIGPDHPEYGIARRIWNGSIDRYPALVVRCLSESDVARSIQFAGNHNLRIAVRGGGHSFPGYSTVDGGLVIDLSLLKDVIVDPERCTAVVSGGARLSDLIRASEHYGLTTPVGTASDTGVAGLTLGGGFGFLTGKFGLTCDNVLSFTLVTAGGSLVRASADENPDLFWGLRGGGGNFGVVTKFEFQLHPMGELLVGMIQHPIEQAAGALRFYREFFADAPDELTVFPKFGTSQAGCAVLDLVASYCGDHRQGQRILEPLRKFGHPAVDRLEVMPYSRLVAIGDEVMPSSGNYYDKGCTLAQLSDEAIDLMIEATLNRTSPGSSIGLQPMHGAFTRIPLDSAAYPSRAKSFMPVIVSNWEDSPAEPHIAWARKLHAHLQPYTLGETYVNFISEEEQPMIASVYGSHYARLQSLKRRYDPDNIFRLNANIKP